jgi:hypothetical protein
VTLVMQTSLRRRSRRGGLRSARAESGRRFRPDAVGRERRSGALH